MNIFQRGDFLLPRQEDLSKWAVIACDQFTAQRDYWQAVEKLTGDEYSTLHLMLPEVYLSGDYSDRIAQINNTMKMYLRDNVFRGYDKCYIYVERRLLDGGIRRGLVGVVDLEYYDYTPGSDFAVRATEKTVLERIPPRKKIREKAVLELSHVLMLCDDSENLIFGTVDKLRDSLPLLYDFDLMLGGGHITGRLVQGKDAVILDEVIGCYEEQNSGRLIYAVGDGNHSLATAKACYEEEKKVSRDENLLSRYAMVELENIRDNAQKFVPIHRLVKETDSEDVLLFLQKYETSDGYSVGWQSAGRGGRIYLDRSLSSLAVGSLQAALDEYLSSHKGIVDYIHGDDALSGLVKDKNSIGFFLQPIDKGDFFHSIQKDGVLPRKTFSMGQAQEKRYYLEARKIKK